MTRNYRNRESFGFAIRDLAVVLTLVVIMAGLATTLTGANRDLSKAAVCAGNLQNLFGGLMAYVNTYNSFPPHNPYPMYYHVTVITPNGGTNGGIDPSMGWLLTHGLGMTPPDTFMHDNPASNHFKWFVLTAEELPSVCVCPAANYDMLFTVNAENSYNGIPTVESALYQYAAFYQTSGTLRSGAQIDSIHANYIIPWGGRNNPIPDPVASMAGRMGTGDNAQGGDPRIFVQDHTGAATSATGSGTTRECWIQATLPPEVQEPGRTYYMADSREYRPFPGGAASGGPAAATCRGWDVDRRTAMSYVYMSTRHYGYANVMYLDGQVNRDGLTHFDANGNALWPLEGTTDQYRCCTFNDPISLAGIGTQHHIMPVLMVAGWEAFFGENGIPTKADP